MDQEKIGKFIAISRKNKGLTQRELANMLLVSDRTIGNWERGRNMPDLSLFQPLCDILGITLDELISGGDKDAREDNIINTINYTNKKINRKDNIIGILLIAFGVFTIIASFTVITSDSSWGSIYSVIGVIISLFGIMMYTKKLTKIKRIICNLSYCILSILLLMSIDYMAVVNIKEAPRFAIIKVYGDQVVYYDTLFYDVVRCNVDLDNETYSVIKNNKYDSNNIDIYCK